MLLSQKSKIIALNTAFLITILLTLSDNSNIFGAPRDPHFGDSTSQCWTEATNRPGEYVTTCCWEVIEPGDPERIGIEYCQNCQYDPSTQTHSDCGEATQARGSMSDIGHISPYAKNDLHELQQEPNQPISPQFGDGIKTDASRADVTEQTSQSDIGSNDGGNSDQDNNSNDRDISDGDSGN